MVLPGDFSHPDNYRDLQSFLGRQDGGMSNQRYYWVTAPDLFAWIIEGLVALGMAREDGGWRRLKK